MRPRICVESRFFSNALESLSSFIFSLCGFGLKKSVATLCFSSSSGRFRGYINVLWRELRLFGAGSEGYESKSLAIISRGCINFVFTSAWARALVSCILHALHSALTIWACVLAIICAFGAPAWSVSL